MRRLHLIGGGALMAVLFAGGAALASAAAADQPEAGKCQVTIDRSQAPDSFQVDRQQLANGDCVCYAYTGPTTQSAAVEQSVAQLQQSGECGEVPAALVPASGTGSGTGSGIVSAGAGVAAILGLVAALNDNQPDSTGA